MTARDPSAIGTSVLVGVDGSPQAQDAAVLGRRLAQAAGGSVHLVTVADQILAEVVAIRSRIATDRIRDALLDAARTKAIRSLEGEFEPDEVEAILTVRLGRPERVIVEVGLEVIADVIVLGGRHHRAPGAWFQRGTVHNLLRVCDRPVVVTGPAGPQVERVIAAVDLSFADEPTIATASRMAVLLEAPLEVFHVVGPPLLPPELDLHIDLDDLMRREAADAERTLGTLLPDAVPRSVVRGDVVSSIRDTAGAGPPTLLVLGAHGKGWTDRLVLGSTTHSILSELPSALAIVPSVPESSPRSQAY